MQKRNLATMFQWWRRLVPRGSCCTNSMFIRSSWRNPVSVTENAGMFETIEYMRAQGVRREPVVDKGARLVRHEQQNETISRH